MFDFAHPAPTPTSFSYTSADNAYDVYGWQVTTHRPAREFSTLTTSGGRSCTMSGGGSATVVTPASYSPHRRYLVRISGVAVGTRTVPVVAGTDRRLRIAVPLGPANPDQQETARSAVTGTAVYTTTVTIT